MLKLNLNTREVMNQRSAVQSDEASLDIKGNGFWGRRGGGGQ